MVKFQGFKNNKKFDDIKRCREYFEVVSVMNTYFILKKVDKELFLVLILNKCF